MSSTAESLQLQGYVVRPATIMDAAAATELFNACEIAETGEPDFIDGEVEAEWKQRDLANEVTLILGPDRKPVGQLAIEHRGHVVVYADIYVHPDHSGRGLGTFLVRRGEEQAQPHVALAPSGARVVLRNVVNGWNKEANALLQTLDYEAIRHFYRMLIDLTEPPAAPEWPAGLTVRPCAPGVDERAIYATVDEAFRDHWNVGPTSFDEWMKRKMADGYDPSLWFQVFDGKQMAAAADCRLNGEMGWVIDVAVRRPWRKRGIATALLQHIFGEFYRRGNTRIGLGVDAQNPHGATRLYERIGMRPVRQFTFYEKVLRDGALWSDDEAKDG
ncbi:MAG: GNAT family N-acetyltransferase [Thermomicrobiales bacterium]